ncbi:MAG: hypothetical protein KBT19_09450 [Lachnospiraceae bacterium]|nr:hypothetical protein [Candidatus Colinaster equi]
MDKIAIGFLGYGTRALDALMEHPLFEVKYFFAPEARLCDDVYNAAEKYRDSLNLEIVKNNEDLEKRLAQIDDVDCFLMNACNIILNKNVLDKMPFYNIHPGRLEDNRGHHPHLWTVLLGEKSSEIVLHEVCTGIDEGNVIAFKDVEIPADANSLEVLDLLEDEIPCLLDRLYKYLKGEVSYEKTVNGGTYRHVLKPEDYRVDFADYKAQQFDVMLGRKIRARAMHHGAFFEYNGNRVYIDKLICKRDIDDIGSNNMNVSVNGDETTVMVGESMYVFHINKIQPI